MKNPSSQKQRPGFTLIEMLVTITIIVILAGLSLGGFKYVSAKQDNNQAEIQIKLLSSALEEYKLDQGQYPISNNDKSTDLYIKLFYEGYEFAETPDREDPGKLKATRIYLSELDPRNNKQGWVDNVTTPQPPASTKILDPWGNEYIYRCPGTINPDFDLISKGQDGATNLTNLSAAENKDDKTNF